jgi:DNA-directed RNA polymerase subunit RPC12/RpoP
MEQRTKDGYQVFAYNFLKYDILVVCPDCSKKAIVKPGNFTIRDSDTTGVKVVCLNCGFNKLLLEKPLLILSYSSRKVITGRCFIIGGSVDPFFHLPLWLQTNFEGHTLWAYNLEHLDFLGNHVEAKLRERNGQALFNKSLGSRLPSWMTSKKNRNAVLKKIDLLRAASEQ